MVQDKELLGRLLEGKRVIALFGSVDEPMLDYVRGCRLRLLADGNPPIHVIINSPGGDVRLGLHIYDLLATYPSAIEGTVVEEACSMAAVILQACSSRTATPNAKILIHSVSRSSVSLDMLSGSDRLQALRDDLQEKQDSLLRILVTRTRRSRNDVEAECVKNTPLSAEAAKAFGLIDKIAPIRDDLTASLPPTTATST